MAEARVVLSAVDQTKAAIESAKRNLEGLGAAATQLKTVLHTVIGAEIVMQMTEMAKSTVDNADAMNDLSQRVGIAVVDLGKYQLATTQSGTTMEALAKGVKGIATNLAEHSDALKKAGLDAKTSDEAILQLADLFASMPDGIEKTNLAVKMFGKSGMDLIPMLNLGRSGLEEAAQKSAKYAATLAILAPQADRFNDNLAELGMLSKLAAMQLANDLMPALQNITQAMIDSRQAGEGFWASMNAGIWAFENEASKHLPGVFESFATAMPRQISKLKDELAGLQSEQKSLRWDPFGSSEKIQSDIDATSRKLTMAEDAYRKYLKTVNGDTGGDKGGSAVKPKKSEADWRAEYKKFIDAIGGTGANKDAISEYDRLMLKLGADVAKASSEAQAALMGYNKAQTEFIELTMTPVWGKATNEWRAQAAAIFETRITSEMQTAAIKKLAAADLEAAQAHDKYLVSLVEGLDKNRQESQAQQEANDRLGLGKEAIAALDAAKLESQAVTLDLLAVKMLDKNLDEVQYNLYKAQAAELRTLATLKKTGAAKSTAIDFQAEQDKLAKDAAQSLHDDVKNALSTAFRDSKDPIQAFGDALGNVIFTRVSNGLADAMATQFLNSTIGKGITSLFGFASGGVMSSAGPLPLKAYANGGVANSPQMAVFGEGRMNEAYVPLPDGRSIPVSMKGGGQPITITIHATVGDVASKSDVVAGMRATANQIVSQLARSQRYGGGLA